MERSAKRVRARLVPFIRRAWKFGVVGASGIVVNTALLAVLSGVLGVHYLAGVVLATQGSTLWNFAFTDAWVFAERRDPVASRRRLRNFWLVNNSALVFRAPVVGLFTDGIGLHYLLSNLITLLAMFAIRYLASEAWIWRTPRVAVESS